MYILSKDGDEEIGVRYTKEMATRGQDISRFFLNYRKYVILIGIALVIQFFLAIRVVFLLPGSWDISGDGSKGPSYIRNHGSQKNVETLQNVKTNVDVSESISPQNTATPVKKTLPDSNASLLTFDVGSLTFVPECNITLKDSISAINRAKTQACKDEIANISCVITNDVLYVKRLPRYCSNKGESRDLYEYICQWLEKFELHQTVYGRYLGCFKDNPKDRILSGHLSLFKDRNSHQICIDLCLQSGFQYAGLQYGVECFCGNSKPSSYLKVENEKCGMKCPVEEVTSFIEPGHLTPWNGNCGGYFVMDVFETGVFQDYELNNKIVGLDGRREDGRLAEKPARTVRIVFFLTLNGRSARQVFRLIKALFHERHFFYIHIDSRQDYLYRELLSLTRILPKNVRFMKSRKATIWGGASLLTVLLSGMKDLVTNAEEWNWDWDYVINLSESDFPLKSTEKLETFLSHNKGRNFVKSHGRDVQKFIQKQGLDKTFYECEHRMWRVADRKLPSGILIDGGSDWIALHRDFVEYVIKSDDSLVSGLKTVFKHTLLPAESFFHTVLRNSNHCRTFVDNNLHVTNWKRKLGCKCQYRTVVDWCGCSPNDFRLTDWNRLQLAESRLLFFGRKFEAIVNQEIINKLEIWLYPDRFEPYYPTMDRFWLSIYHYHDIFPRPDDALVTLGRSLARVAARNFAAKYDCQVVRDQDNFVYQDGIAELVEMTAYNHDDKFQGILVRFKTSIARHVGAEGVPEVFTVHLEAWFGIKDQTEFAPWSQKIAKYRSKIQDISIGTDYDQKEQIFRNFAYSIGPFSEPILIYNIVADEPFNVTAVFIDPSNIVQAVQNSTTEVASGTTVSLTNFVKPVLRTPLQPGNWTVKVLSLDGYLLAEVKMLVLPIEFYQARKMTLANSKIINWFPSDEEYTDDDGSNIDSKYETLLQERIDRLVSEFYQVQDFCLESEQNHLLLSSFKTVSAKDVSQGQSKSLKMDQGSSSMDKMETSVCSHSQWSSMFPDPKSSITGIDPETGFLLP
ncbi:Xylosyltransferase oxt [Orchesella cincta]|uniref:protein xylosyltransferase n=1 Tax=Orchesella cincta TaxID=48709 RepID=A0A1D2MZK8_ORCCI|nr:Xylosyltransferase oxt [Orchesella cincta]